MNQEEFYEKTIKFNQKVLEKMDRQNKLIESQVKLVARVLTTKIGEKRVQEILTGVLNEKK